MPIDPEPLPNNAFRLTPEFAFAARFDSPPFPEDLFAIIQPLLKSGEEAFVLCREIRGSAVWTLLLPAKARGCQSWKGTLRWGDYDVGAPMGLVLDQRGPEGEVLGVTFDGEVIDLE